MRILRFFGLLVVLALVAGGYLFYRLQSPYRAFTGTVYVDLPHGTSTESIAQLLMKAGVVRSQWDFLLARMATRGPALQAGEYRFEQPSSVREVLDRIERGDVFFLPLVVPEGRNLYEIAADLERLGLFPAPQFIAAARDPKMISDLDPEAPTLEGYLFPNTYRLNRHATPESVCRLMTAKFREAWSNLKSEANVHATITLASLVEKEGKVAEDRPRIARSLRESPAPRHEAGLRPDHHLCCPAR